MGRHRTEEARFSGYSVPFWNGILRKTRRVITCDMLLTLVVHQGCGADVATLHCMATYHVLAAGTVLWLLASAGATDSHLPVVLTASLTAGALLLNRVVRSRQEKQKL
jgi:hypothetical protein